MKRGYWNSVNTSKVEEKKKEYLNYLENQK